MSTPARLAQLSTTPEIIEELRLGRMVVLVDDEDRENEGDLVMAASAVTSDAINFMIKHGRGLVCLTLTGARCKQLGLEPISRSNKTKFDTAFTLPIEAATGVTTGISAADRARTIAVAVAKRAQPDDIIQPGHIFPIQAKEHGVLVREGHTEASCDLAAMAGLEAAGVICEILNDDGTMARLPQLQKYAAQHGLKLGTIADLIVHRFLTENLIDLVKESKLVHEGGDFDVRVYRDRIHQRRHICVMRKNRSHAAFTVSMVNGLSAADAALLTEKGKAQEQNYSIFGAFKMAPDFESGNQNGMLILLNVDEKLAEPSGANTLREHGLIAQMLKGCGVEKINKTESVNQTILAKFGMGFV